MRRIAIVTLVLLLAAFSASAQIAQTPLAGLTSVRTVSAVATQAQFVFDLAVSHDTLAIVAVCSAGTAGLTVESSVDNTNWITIDSIAGAGTQAKQYTSVTVGASTAVSPLAFRYVRITGASCGGGNTNTVTASVK